MKKHLATAITCCRILIGILLLLPTARSPYALYLLGGLTDLIDGTIARKTNSVSTFGSKLDTVADFVFFLAATCKFFPVIHLPLWIILWAIAIGTVKLVPVLVYLLRTKRLYVEHTVLNKITGVLLFLFPLVQRVTEPQYAAVLVCAVATLSAVWELCLICSDKTVQ